MKFARRAHLRSLFSVVYQGTASAVNGSAEALLPVDDGNATSAAARLLAQDLNRERKALTRRRLLPHEPQTHA